MISGSIKCKLYCRGNDPSRLSLPYTRGRPCEMCPNACRLVRSFSGIETICLPDNNVLYMH